MDARSSAHPNVRINHRIDALPVLFLGFHALDVASSGGRLEIAFLPDASRISNDHVGHRTAKACISACRRRMVFCETSVVASE